MDKYRIGVEISEKKLQLAVVAKQKNSWQLIETFSLAVTPDNMRQILQEARQSIARSIRHTNLSLPYHHVLMKEIYLDASLNANEIYQHLQQQATALFGKPANHWCFDFEPYISSTKISQQACYRVAAAPCENVLTTVRTCRELGFHVQIVTVDILALAHLTHTLQNYQPGQTQAILWLKAHELLFIVTQSGHLIFSKTAVYTGMQSMGEIFTPLIHFFNGLFPQHALESIFLINDHLPFTLEGLNIENTALNTAVWQIPHAIQSQEFCSLGLAIYGN